MEDLRTLFHTPEKLSPQELKLLESRINSARLAPYSAAVFGSAAYYLVALKYFKQPFIWQRFALVLTGSLVFGLYRQQAIFMNKNVASHDSDILRELDQRFVRESLNTTGLGNNYVDFFAQAPVTRNNRPYQ